MNNKTLDELVPLVNDWFQDRNLAFGDGLGAAAETSRRGLRAG